MAASLTVHKGTSAFPSKWGLTRLQSLARQSPRASSALLFDGATLTVTYFPWIPDAWTSGLTPAITIAGVVRARAALLTGRCLLDDPTRSFDQDSYIARAVPLTIERI